MKSKLLIRLENEGYITFPNYELDLKKFAKNKHEEQMSSLFFFDLVAVNVSKNVIHVVFFIRDNLSENLMIDKLFSNYQFKNFVLNALWQDFKGCGLAGSRTKFQIGLNYTGEDVSNDEEVKNFCSKREFYFWSEKEET